MSRPAPHPARSLEMDGHIWRFALSFYREPNVAPACLTLQDELGVDVGILIFAIFAAARGVALSDADVREADRLVAGWRDEVVLPLRRLRRRLKTGPEPAPTPATDALRIKVKAIELQAEQNELAVLENWLTSRIRNSVDPAQMASVPDGVARYFGGDGTKSFSSAVKESLRVLSLAALRASGNTAEQTNR